MELPSKLLEQIAFKTRPKIEQNMLIVMGKSTHEEHLSQPLQTNDKQFEMAVTFLTAYNGILMSQNQIISFISRKQLKVRILLELSYHLVLTKLNRWIRKLKWLLLRKVITLKVIIHSESNQILVPQAVLLKY